MRSASQMAFHNHIVSSEGIAVIPGKIKAIIEAPTPKNAKTLSRFPRQIQWHSQMLRYLVHFVTTLNAVVHRTTFKWTEIENKPYMVLKVMLTQAPVVQPPNWAHPLHVFVDTSVESQSTVH